MTEQINEQISAFIDDELSEEESAFLVRRFERNSQAHAQALRYTLIGAALRGELPHPDPLILRRRIAAALDGTAPAPVRVPPRWHSRLARPAIGVGIAASVAVAAIFGLRAINEAREASDVSGPMQVREVVAESPSYIVPPDTSEPRVITPPVRLTNYLMHHGEYASGLSRTLVHSNVVTASDLPPIPVVLPSAAPVAVEATVTVPER
jgi:sigma-E factor negative regulatory protein RseA